MLTYNFIEFFTNTKISIQADSDRDAMTILDDLVLTPDNWNLDE